MEPTTPNVEPPTGSGCERPAFDAQPVCQTSQPSSLECADVALRDPYERGRSPSVLSIASSGQGEVCGAGVDVNVSTNCAESVQEHAPVPEDWLDLQPAAMIDAVKAVIPVASLGPVRDAVDRWVAAVSVHDAFEALVQAAARREDVL